MPARLLVAARRRRSLRPQHRIFSQMTAASNSVRLAIGNGASRALIPSAALARPGDRRLVRRWRSPFSFGTGGETGAVTSSGERWGKRWTCFSPLSVSVRGGPVPEHFEMSTGGNSTSLTRPISCDQRSFNAASCRCAFHASNNTQWDERRAGIYVR